MIQEIAQNGQNLRYGIHAHFANWGKYNNFQRTLRMLWGNFKILGQNIHPCSLLMEMIPLGVILAPSDPLTQLNKVLIYLQPSVVMKTSKMSSDDLVGKEFDENHETSLHKLFPYFND